MNPPEPVRTQAKPACDLASALASETAALRRWLGRLAGRAHAEDLAQEALARAWSYRASRDEAQPLGPWLRRIAFRVFLDHRARQKARRAASELTAEPSAPPPREAEAAEARAELERRLAWLEPHERDVLLRFHQSGESIEAIARSLGRPTGTIKSWLHRARAKLVARAERTR
ncbi:MAG: sigma-70 family RNA polymerase sigma factor [Planctomycetes bacterium]|nr:sigma-70 family RNA polymerase sigma factor [Planctomycetota bacterium]